MLLLLMLLWIIISLSLSMELWRRVLSKTTLSTDTLTDSSTDTLPFVLRSAEMLHTTFCGQLVDTELLAADPLLTMMKLVLELQ